MAGTFYEAVFGTAAFGYESITVHTSVVRLTHSEIFPDGRQALEAWISVEDGSIRYRIDGGDPTISEGHHLQKGDVIRLTPTDSLVKFRAIRAGGVDAILRVTYLR